MLYYPPSYPCSGRLLFLIHPPAAPPLLRVLPGPGPDAPDQFSVFIDAAMDSATAQAAVVYMQEGGFVDASTAAIDVRALLFNHELGVLSSVSVGVEFTSAGTITARSRIDTLAPDVLGNPLDFFRVCLEVIFVLRWVHGVRKISIEINAAMQLNKMRLYLQAPGTVADILHLLFSGIEIAYWAVLLSRYDRLEVGTSFAVYEDVGAAARTLRLKNGGAGLSELKGTLEGVGLLNNLVAVYWTLHGVTIILLMSSLLRQCHFQPRLGMITRTLSRAAIDLGACTRTRCLQGGISVCDGCCAPKGQAHMHALVAPSAAPAPTARRRRRPLLLRPPVSLHPVLSPRVFGLRTGARRVPHRREGVRKCDALARASVLLLLCCCRCCQ